MDYLKNTAFAPFDKNLSDKEKAHFLCSRAYCDMLSDIMYPITLQREKVILLPPFGDDLAFTDGNAVYICTVHKDYIHYGIDEITKNNVALAIHEPFHKKYSDFAYLKRLMSKQTKHPSLRKWLLNAICDARIERVGCYEYKGYAVYIVAFRKKFYANATSNTSPNTPKEQAQFQDLLSNILLFATCGLPKFPLEGEYKEAFEKCRPLIIAGRRSDSTPECDVFVEQIFDILVPLIPPQFEAPNIPNGMTEWSSGSGKNGRPQKIKTGGADFMSFDEDADSDNADDADASNDANQQGSSGSQSGKSGKKGKKNSSKSSSGKSSDDTNDGSDENNTGSQGGSSNKEDKKDGDKVSNSGSDGDKSDDNEENSAENEGNSSNGNSSQKDTDDTQNAEDGKSGDDTSDTSESQESSSDSPATSSNSNKPDIKNDGDFNDEDKDTVKGMDDEEFEDMLRKTIEGIVPAYEKEVRDNQADAMVNAELESGQGNGYNVTVVRPSVDNRHKYSEIVSRVAPISNRLAHEMKKVIHYNQDEVRRGITKGKIDPSGLAHVYNGHCFYKRIEKSNESDLFVSILLDCSGSMSGSKLISMVTQTTIILEACKALKIPISIIGFHGSGSRTSIVHYFDYKHRSALNRSNIVQMFASGCTPLSEAIEYHRKYLKKVKHQDKLCFIITDGEPDSNADAIRSFNALKKEAMSFGIAIDDGINQLKSIFGNCFIDGRDLSKLPVEICTIIRKNILKP